MRGSILIIDDDPGVQAVVRNNLEREGFAVLSTPSAVEGLQICSVHQPDLVILDIMLPDGDGIEVCRMIRGDDKIQNTPVIFLSAKSGETDRIIGLEVGGSDYMVKPFFVRELVARVKRHLVNPAEKSGQPVPGIAVDRDCRCARVHGKPIDLTKTELRLLETLVSNPGVVYSRGDLLAKIWTRGVSVTERTVDVYVLRLRQRLAKHLGDANCIRSVRGLGYRFDPLDSEGT